MVRITSMFKSRSQHEIERLRTDATSPKLWRRNTIAETRKTCVRAFIKIQDVIEAIERAVWHERYIADPKSEPFSPFGFGS